MAPERIARARSLLQEDPMICLPVRPAVFAFVALLGLAACSGTDPITSGSGGSGGAAAATPITQDVVAAKGGSVADPDKTVALTIPAGALGEDTKITLTVSPKEEATATRVYTFGPAGVTLTTPAALTINTDGVTVPANMKAVLGMQSGTTWAEVPGAVQGSGTLEGSVTILAAYSVIFVAAAVAGQCDVACMSQADAVCCTTCGCTMPVSCKPVCGSGTMWDCEIGCCYDYVAHTCVP
jgi:hypothetical protein